MSDFRPAAQRVLILMATAVLGACTVGPDFVRPAPPDADRYTRAVLPPSTTTADGQVQRFMSGAVVAADWWRLFQSDSLDALVRQALANNPTIEAAEASLRQSLDNLKAGQGVFSPQVNAAQGASRQHTAPEQQGLTTSGSTFSVFTLSGVISYTLDVFGGERRMVEGLQAQSDYQRHAARAAYLALSANVVNTAIARAAYAAEIRVTEQLIAIERQQLRATEAQFRAGTAPYSTVLSLRALIAANLAALPALAQKVDQAEHLLATLVGAEPAKAALPEIELARISLPLDLPVSMPSELVRQRPDILSSEAQLHVASANIGVATAAMFPSFTLSGAYGAAGLNGAVLSAASGRFWSLGQAATLPVFAGGRLWFGRQAAIEAYRQSQAIYRQTVLNAFAQVADVLTALGHDAETLQAQAEAQQATREALHLVQINYRAGLVAYLDVLVADVQFHQASIAYQQALAQRLQDSVGLFVALGGGWWNASRAEEEGMAP